MRAVLLKSLLEPRCCQVQGYGNRRVGRARAGRTERLHHSEHNDRVSRAVTKNQIGDDTRVRIGLKRFGR